MTEKSDQYRLARESAGLSVSQASRLLGIQRGYILMIEGGQMDASDEQLAALAKCYDVTEDFLKTGIPGDNLMDHLAKWHDAPDWMQHNILIEWKQRQSEEQHRPS